MNNSLLHITPAQLESHLWEFAVICPLPWSSQRMIDLLSMGFDRLIQRSKQCEDY